MSFNSFNAQKTLTINGQEYDYFSLPALAQEANFDLKTVPYSLRVLLENLLRHEDGDTVDRGAILGLAGVAGVVAPEEIAYYPTRVLMPDSSGGPLLVDLAAMRDVFVEQGLDPNLINPAVPVDFVVDHSAVAEYAGTAQALEKNLAIEFSLNKERYGLIRWAQQAFTNFRVIPPGNGILHQINIEYLAQVVRVQAHETRPRLVIDTLVGMDSHTPMVNGLGIIGWGVGGIEAGSVMLGEPISMLVPQVVGCRLTGKLRPNITATDLVLTLTSLFRAHGVVGKFVEFCGPGLDTLPVFDRATVANMAPEYGATVGYFPIDHHTIAYLRQTGRSQEHCKLVEEYARAQQLWRAHEPTFNTCIELDLSSVMPTMAGPSRPQDRLALSAVAASFRQGSELKTHSATVQVAAGTPACKDGDVVIAAITSCTNTSNPSVMIGAGLLARNALARGLTSKPWVKTSLSPGSRRVAEYLALAGLDKQLDALGFQVVGFGCMTCMGSSGDLAPAITQAIAARQLRVAAVLSGNRNFEARIHPLAKANYLGSPALVVAYAIAGTVLIDLSTEPLGIDQDGRNVFLHELWPSDDEIRRITEQVVTPDLFAKGYSTINVGTTDWETIAQAARPTYQWEPSSTYLQSPPYVQTDPLRTMRPMRGARVLALLGDNITTDHITPVGSTSLQSQVGQYLTSHGVAQSDFNSLSSRRANPEVVARTTYANVRLQNEMVPEQQGDLVTFLAEKSCRFFRLPRAMRRRTLR